MLVNGTKSTTSQLSLTNQLSLLPSSFPEYVSSKSYYTPPKRSDKLLSEGAALLASGKVTKGISNFEQAIKETPNDHPNNPFLASLHHHAAVAHQSIGKYYKAIEHTNKRIETLNKSKDYYGVEQASKELAQIHTQNGTLKKY